MWNILCVFDCYSRVNHVNGKNKSNNRGKIICEYYYLHTDSDTYCSMALRYIFYCSTFRKVRLLSVIFQSSFGSAEFRRQFMQCARKKRKKVFKLLPHHAASHYIQSSLWGILIYAHAMKVKLKPRLTLQKNDEIITFVL